ncbi:phage tail protein I [Aliiroseovarius lamellibrachiae]|uniref:phage tail protein I n=1 Tax=Aliiroseovarius lamellibrachiae TaxID=1924933 RepID=UPI001BE01546|nr:phage tail protein I [Aliiroseovarius lamellibrachiae]MBT2131228.1 phage tail protein I [Aliiroseovarius lamellibrachiae]
MFDFASILPPNHTPLEGALEQAIASSKPNLAPVSQLMNPQTCPAELLDWLAWAFSVDDWDTDWGEQRKRIAIQAAVFIHRRKGTPGAIRRALDAFGYGGAAITEGFGAFLYNGELIHDGSEDYGEPDNWAEYRVYLERPITIDQAEKLKRILRNVAPARCHLKGLFFTQAANRYNAAISYDGTNTYGVVQ